LQLHRRTDHVEAMAPPYVRARIVAGIGKPVLRATGVRDLTDSGHLAVGYARISGGRVVALDIHALALSRASAAF
jgi:hypothetical protein